MRPPTRSFPLLGAALALLALGACGEDRIAGSTPGEDGVVLTDGSGGPDGTGGEDVPMDVPLIDTATPDASKPGGDVGPSGDAGGDAGGTGGLGDPCDGDADCASGVCVPGADGLVCTEPCADGACPDGWACETVGDAAPVALCFPRFAAWCHPCTDDGPCLTQGADGRCIPLGDAGAFCGVPCAASDDCPADSTCETVEASDGSSVQSCVPTSGECACNGAATSDGATTWCRVANEHGTCEGERSCGADGLSACSAAAAVAESCNGADDDCDGATDEGLGGEPCTLANDLGECPGTTVCADGSESCAGDEATAELCNGADDDCDGDTDEDWPGLGAPCDGPDDDACPDGLLGCDGSGAGTVCEATGPVGIVEICNGVDDDCDGATDEDWPALGAPCDGPDSDACDNGAVVCSVDGTGTSCGAEAPEGIAEACNGVDDDCDGSTDEDWPELGTPCDGPDDDECATGTWACAQDGAGAACANEAPVGAESCNGLDDDCDGATDEDWPTLGAPCDGPDTDDCANGAEVCAADGLGTTCGDEVASDLVETCNGVDDDCDGAVDEDWPTLGEPCDGPDEDACAGGLWVCGDVDPVCEGDQAPSPEVCDGVDNDCDGDVDEGCAPTSVISTFGGASLGGTTGGVELRAGVGLPVVSTAPEVPGAAWSVRLGLYATATAAP